MKKSIAALISIAILILIPITSAVDLSEFPGMYLEEDGIKKNTAIIVGKSAQAQDVLGSIDIAMTLQSKSMGKTRSVDIAKLDTEVRDLTAYNSIVVGGPCINSAAAYLMGYPSNCLQDFQEGKAIIKLYPFENGNVAMLVAGTSALDTRRATYVVAHYEDYKLTGTERAVAGVSLNDIQIKSTISFEIENNSTINP